MGKILEIRSLSIDINGRKVVDDLSFSVSNGEVVAIVGESGSGKTMTALAMLGLLPREAVIKHGDMIFQGESLLKKNNEEMRDIRGKKIGMVFQEPFSSLNPVMPVGVQIGETLLAHHICRAREVKACVASLLADVKLPEKCETKYPHELSGGMRQRVMLAIALSCDPELLILDEPTTALDVMLQKHILDTIKHIQREREIATVFVTHDLSLVKMLADQIVVMRSGRMVETGSRDEVLKTPKKKYTQHLIGCIPLLGDKRKRLPIEEIM